MTMRMVVGGLFYLEEVKLDLEKGSFKIRLGYLSLAIVLDAFANAINDQ
ncbi:hypothetical protein LCR01_13690 [Companilactobacillus crustorum]|uniref:Uncharacterized protein n=1 Tax=Companilactobacillus crustorum TaxID=392416 RepID=A0AB34ABP0_9LACO|nr:hypothetical protein LCR01_13690 [Companilactobacillus crustorum]